MSKATLTEAQEQKLVIDWFSSYAKTKGIDERLLMASVGGIVIGGDARVRAIRAANLKRQGYRNGTPDLRLAIPKWEGKPWASSSFIIFAGMDIEMKATRKGAKLTPEQSEMHRILRCQGYNSLTCYGFEEAKRAITAYISG